MYQGGLLYIGLQAQFFFASTRNFTRRVVGAIGVEVFSCGSVADLYGRAYGDTMAVGATKFFGVVFTIGYIIYGIKLGGYDIGVVL